MKFGRVDQWMLLGGGQILIEFASGLLKDGFKVVVVTSERHEKELDFDLLEDEPFEVIVSQDVNSDRKIFNKITKQTLGVSFGATWIFKSRLIGQFGGKLVNLHPSKLPQDRGGGPWSWKVLRNERKSYITLHQVDPGIDTGKIIKYKEFTYPLSCRLPMDYQNYAVAQYRFLLKEFVKEVQQDKAFTLKGQKEHRSTYWPRFATDIHGYIDWGWKLKEIERFICAFDDPYKGASTFVNGAKVRIKKCLTTRADAIFFHPFQRGLVYRISEGKLFVAADQGSLVVSSVTNDRGIGVNGKIKVGDRFYTPVKYLEKALQYRAIYTSKGLKK